MQALSLQPILAYKVIYKQVPATPLTSPLQAYQQDLASGAIQADKMQWLAIKQLHKLYQALTHSPRSPGLAMQSILRFVLKKPTPPVNGLYLWGQVGRGKTYLMDVFFQCLPFKNKKRIHFHRFMQRIHQDLQVYKGQADPLKAVAAGLAKQTRIICFDEFFVADIGDAMLLAGLFKQLFAYGITLVATSNMPPQRLYENGLQRSQFLPAIALILRHTQTLHLDSDIDYRLRSLEQADIYHAPNDQTAQEKLAKTFQQLCPGSTDAAQALQRNPIQINGRSINVIQKAEGVVWFDFNSICHSPRSLLDYIEIARQYHSVLLSKLPRFGKEDEDQARRFIGLVDEFYDRNVKLVITAAVTIDQLYPNTGLLDFEFQRTRSRLMEMQSYHYLSKAHLP